MPTATRKCHRGQLGDQIELETLQLMVRAFAAAPPSYRPSPFWEGLVADHMHDLKEWGFDNFKRTVNTHYFNWQLPSIVLHQLLPVLKHWLRHPDRAVFTSRFPDYDRPCGEGIASLSLPTATIYHLYVAMLAHMVSQHDPAKLFETLEEPLVGNPWRIRFRGRWTSQDLCNSIHEFYSAWDERSGPPDPDIAELGAGYGRLAYVFLKALPGATYTIIDIPPALYVAQEYLSRVFPDTPVFRFRPFDSFEDVREEYERSRIRFLLANQIELLPPRQFDLIANISSLNEMTRPQIVHYFQHFERLCRGRFYSKQWRKSRAPGNGFVIREDEYPIPPSWRQVWHRRHPIQRRFFDALYEVRTGLEK